METKIILASGSPRRRELMQQVGLSFEVCPARGEEKITGSIPSEVVEELAYQKACEVLNEKHSVDADNAILLPENRETQNTPLVNGHFVKKSSENFGKNFSRINQRLVVIGADTVVSYKQKILGKPKDKMSARQMITDLQGHTHQVYTGVSVLWEEGVFVRCVKFSEETEVLVYPMTEGEIEAYISTDEPYDKAGGYGIQGMFAAYVKGIRGDYNNVVGLPIARVYQLLKQYNFV